MSPPTTGLGVPGSEAKTVIAVAVCAMTIAVTATAARFYARCILIKNTGLDDWALLVGTVFTVFAGAIMISSTRYGLGLHTSDLHIETLIQFLKQLFMLIVTYNVALAALKASFLLQYRRIFTSSTTLYITNGLLVVVAIGGLVQVFVSIFFCIPISGFWDVTGNAKCLPRLPMWYVNAAMNIVTDCAIFVLPLPALYKLQLGKKQKTVLIFVFGLGFFVCAISIVRIRTLKAAAASKDPTYGNVAAECWTMAEMTGGIVCACIPTLRPLAAKFFPSAVSLAAKSCNGYEMQSEPKVIRVNHTFDIAEADGSKENLWERSI